MSSTRFNDRMIEAIHSDDLSRLREVLAVARQHLLEYGDLPTMISMLEHQIAKLEKHQG